MSADAPLTLGTAGHIDHGKTALIRALTGVDTDRLPQERARGISIELGYARMHLPSGRRLSVIDVPGHERFVRAMVAGATGIDLYLMTIAADDGVMPQTREHAAVLRALDVTAGVVAVTKSDLADPELALLEASELLPGAEAVAVSARAGTGLDELRAALDRAAAGLPGRAERAEPARLHVDRVFTIRGAGTVVTGTLWSGRIARGDELAVLPAGDRARVRGVQVHDEAVERAVAGQRVAVNLTGLSVEEIDRGDVLSQPGSGLAPTYLVDVELGFEDRAPEPGERVTVHHGTRETPARMAWLGGRFWQLRLERQLVPARGDRVVVRQIAPPDTLGGGTVLDPHPRKHGPGRELTARLERLSRGEPDDAPPPEGRPAEPPPPLEPAAAELGPGALALAQRLLAAGFEPPLDSELAPVDLAALRRAGVAVRVSKTLHYHRDTLAEVRRRVLELAARGDGAVTLAQLRDELATSRKFAQALLEHLDAEKVTLRRGEAHVVRASALRELS
ncbi:MAG TPA: selenocysteine-specific translation elongation factor [Solirubrobacteraceae bacterium]|nr:selenocysteine-specific translation elongation factor [Solirubrobacteraceae bacterium]